MNVFIKSSILTVAFTPVSLFAFTDNLPAILCVDAQEYWDGNFTIEVSKENSMGDIFASVYDQSPEGRFLISNTKVTKQEVKDKLVFTGSKFRLEMESTPSHNAQSYVAEIQFKYEDSIQHGVYLCLVYK